MTKVDAGSNTVVMSCPESPPADDLSHLLAPEDLVVPMEHIPGDDDQPTLPHQPPGIIIRVQLQGDQVIGIDQRPTEAHLLRQEGEREVSKCPTEPHL